MRKLVAALSAGIIITGAAATTVSAEENEHKVEAGESLWKIADQYDTSVQNLLDINSLTTTVIHPEDVIYISQPDEDGEESSVYTVEKGDTLSDISKEFGVSVKDIKEWNKLSSDIIVIGAELSINGATAEAAEPAVEEEPAEEPATEEESAEEPAEEPAEEEVVVEQTSNEESASESEEQSSDESPQGKTISVEATAYTAGCNGCSGVTATGVDLNADPNAKVIAVDPSVIPLGSKVYVEGYGYATAADTGGAIQGNKIDLHVPSQEEALSFGRQQVNVTIVE
ncbi:3D domain-containing protein [Oceanobacillus neutriphilus]|uniref:Peptidase M23 n=1 Tax=Oceanobacillus neutriphilus TaxID=531815 RepID=A0ABQ2NSN7_9BACI|nr:3D domain-containing protein [Oceanobacillus neutriphilus]GGP09753.1 peptidase M23 [Oceanobacillus neutriphilus]